MMTLKAVTTSRFSDALEQWTSVLGPSHVSVSTADLERAETATFQTHQKVQAILRPGAAREVQACVEIANRFKVPLYPVSRQKNWGYGSAVPVESHNVLIELSRMNRILELNEELGYMTVEPGVTFQQAYDFLQARGSKRMLSVLGGTPHGSVLANTLERGIGNGPYTDRVLHISGIEAILPNGMVVHSGLERYSGEHSKVVRWAPGPAIDGLFFQSNLGIVTKMTVYLALLPEHYMAFRAIITDDSKLEAFVEAARLLRASGVITTNITLANDIRAMATSGQFPWEETGGKTPLTREQRERIVHQRGIGLWNAGGAVYGLSRAQIAAHRSVIKKALKGKVDKLFFIDDFVARRSRLLNPLYKWLWNCDIVKLAEATYHKGALRGVPSQASMNQVYWRKRMAMPQEPDPDRDRCGVYWICPEIPFVPKAVRDVQAIMEEEATAAGFEPFVSFVATAERSLKTVSALIYDRDIPGEDEKAKECYKRLASRFLQQGYYPYRLGLQSMGSLPASVDQSDAFLKLLKETLDPNQILAPNRYVRRGG